MHDNPLTPYKVVIRLQGKECINVGVAHAEARTAALPDAIWIIRWNNSYYSRVESFEPAGHGYTAMR
jgi:hypothetical protein